MKNKLLFVLVVFLFSTGAWAVSDCVMEKYNVTYSCGDGTLADGKTLPAAATATYGETVTLSAIGVDLCTPPSDEYKYAGQSIYMDGVQVADSGQWNWVYYQDPSTPKGFSFEYLFVGDIEVRPKWAKIATQDNMNAYLGAPDNTYCRQDSNWKSDGYSKNIGMTYTFETYDTNYGAEVAQDAVGTWTAYYPWGWISGESVCSGYNEQEWMNSAPFYVAVDQDSVKEQQWGIYCYCRVTAPFESKWFWRTNAGGWSSCDINCESICGDYAAYWGKVASFWSTPFLRPDAVANDVADVPM